MYAMINSERNKIDVLEDKALNCRCKNNLLKKEIEVKSETIKEIKEIYNKDKTIIMKMSDFLKRKCTKKRQNYQKLQYVKRINYSLTPQRVHVD